MDFNATIDLIIRDLDEAREIIDDLKKYPGVPVLQVELAKSKCKSAGEVIALLKEPDKELSQEQELIIKKPEHKVQAVAQVVQNIEETESRDIQPVEKTLTQIRKKTTKTEIRETVSGDIPDLFPAEGIMEEAGNVSTDKPGHKILADKFSPPKGIIHEQFGSHNTDDQISEIPNTKPLTNLSEAIGVNDRFLMIREIFNGNTEAFNQALSRLNDVSSLGDAKAIIMSYTGNDAENEAIIQLIDLVKRKLSVNE
jgi:hypothetical protein